jgi:hypothetical protein
MRGDEKEEREGRDYAYKKVFKEYYGSELRKYCSS